MTKDGFLQLLSLLTDLSPSQRQHLTQLLVSGGEQPEIIQRLEQSKAETPTCPHCQSGLNPHRWGTHKGVQRYRCRDCKKTFTALTKTPLARLKKREQWMAYFATMLDSMPLRKAAKHCGISLDTSFRWRHRFLKLVDSLNADELSGVVEVDETFFRESFKGKRNLTERRPRRRGNAHSAEATLIPVLVARDRNRAVADFVMPNMTIGEVESRLLSRIPEDSVLCTDGHMTYERFAQKHGYNHKVLNAAQNIRVIERAYHIQGVNAYHQRLKAWIIRFKGVATKYMHRYLGWFRWFELKRNQPQRAIDLAMDCVAT